MVVKIPFVSTVFVTACLLVLVLGDKRTFAYDRSIECRPSCSLNITHRLFRAGEIVQGAMELEQLLELGRELNLEGEQLLRFAQQRKEQMEKRRAIEEEREAKKFDIAERREREALEREERQKKRDHERTMKELELKQAEIMHEGKDNDIDTHHPSPKFPKLPKFCDGKDEMDSSLMRFERFATAMKWPETDWATSLCALLTGKALEVYIRLPASKAIEYKALKAALLYANQLTEEGFIIKFRSTSLDSGETYTQFCDRIKHYLIRWVEVAGVPKSFDGLVDLLLKEQIHRVCGKDLSIFLKERQPKDLKELVRIADRYVEAHRSKPDRKSPIFGNNKTRPNQHPNQSQPQVQPKSSDKLTRSWRDSRTCHKCGKVGHIARDCFSRRCNPTQGSSSAKPVASVLTESTTRETESSMKNASTPAETVATCLPLRDHSGPSLCSCGNPISGEDVTLSCGHTLPVVSAACTDGDRMPVKEGYMGQKRVLVLRDSGCSTVVVRRDLVQDSQLTNLLQKCVFLDGTVRTCPVAEVTLDTPFY
ncbi:uncharacterized protein LOC110977995 [Acanthaster planci]|uniref:Uncharacterized protein LOC110977995 n=1 Tax=Acanthaster planci TaxID=133434 RepID=A0A8B7Y6U6_ACAPL|nr:uncharacterized protein LOC110977995 [Acanthaster planci]